MRWVAICLAIAACGDDVPDPGLTSEFRSGARLRAIVDHADGGASLFVGWHDTKLDLDCDWIRLADGEFHCAPGVHLADRVFFADSACMSPAYRVPTCGPAAPSLVGVVPDGCANPGVVRLEPLFDARDVSQIYGGRCGGISILNDLYTYYSVAAPIDPAMFVAATVERVDRGHDLAADAFVAADGTIDARALYDRRLGWHCDPDVDAMQCLPHYIADRAFSGDYSGLMTIAGFSDSPPFCGEGPVAVHVSADFDSVGPERADGAWFPVAENQLAPTRAPFGKLMSFYEIGSTLDLADAAGTPVHLEGTGRVKVLAAFSQDGQRLRGLEFGDPQVAPCVPMAAADGQLRCVPPASNVNGVWYADPACTQMLIGMSAGLPPPAWYVDGNVECGGIAHRIVRVGGSPVTLSTVYVSDPVNGCISMSPYGYDVYPTVDVAPSMFEPITRAIE